MLWQGPLDTWNIWSVCTILQITKRYLGTFHALPFLDWLENGRFYPPEYLASLVWDASISLITLLAYTAIAGAVGAGRLSDIAIRYGYHRDQFDVLLVTVVLPIALVQGMQSIFQVICKKIDKRHSA